MRLCNAYFLFFMFSSFSASMKSFGYNTPQYTHNLARDNFKLVPYFARPYIKRHKLGKYECDEILQEGYIGLILASRKYDESCKLAFSTYSSYWIKSYMTKYIRKKDRFRIPLSLDEDRCVVPSSEPLIELELAIDALEPLERELVRKRYFEKITIKQIALEQCVSRNTIANYFKKISTKLRYQMTFQSESSQP